MINKHNDLCGCNYCVLLKDYLDLKRYKNRVLNRCINVENWVIDDYSDYYNLKRDFKIAIKNLKLEKNKLKLITYV